MKQRIITGIVAAALFLPIVVYGGIPFILLTYILATIALSELYRMKQFSLLSFHGITSLLLLWGLLLPNEQSEWLFSGNISKMEMLFLGVLLLLTYTVVTKNQYTFEDVGFSLLSLLYIGIGFYYFIEARLAGLHYIFYALFIIWATDTGAYFFGRAFGKRKLWPDISPNKTVEGSIGGVVSALIVAFIFQLFVQIDQTIIGLTVMTVVVSIFGQIGDLVESAFKRHFRIKDSGKILPGHGGILDRFDSLLFILPLLHFFY